jgi:hypothetical protein
MIRSVDYLTSPSRHRRKGRKETAWMTHVKKVMKAEGLTLRQALKTVKQSFGK